MRQNTKLAPGTRVGKPPRKAEWLGGKPAPVVDGFTGDQQFFIGYAQSWREKVREPALRNQRLTDGHAPGEYRALTVRNMSADEVASPMPRR